MGCGSSQAASVAVDVEDETVSSDEETVVEEVVKKSRKSKKEKEPAEEVDEENDTDDDEDDEDNESYKKPAHKVARKSTGSAGSDKGSRKGSGKERRKLKKASVPESNDDHPAQEVDEDSDNVEEQRRSERKSSGSSSRGSSGSRSSRSKKSAKERRRLALQMEAEAAGDSYDDGDGSCGSNGGGSDEGTGLEDPRAYSARSKDSGFADEEDDSSEGCDVKFISDESPEAQQDYAEQLERPPTPELELCGVRIEDTKNRMLHKQKTKKKRAREERELMSMCQTNAMDLPPLGISRPKSRGGGLAFDIELHDDGELQRPKTPAGPNGELRMPAGLESRLKTRDRSLKKKKPKDIVDIQKKLIAAERRKQKQERERLSRIEAIDKTHEVESTNKMQTVKQRQTETKLENKIHKVESNREHLIAERKAKFQAQQQRMQEVKRRQAEMKAREKAELHGEDFDENRRRPLKVL